MPAVSRTLSTAALTLAACGGGTDAPNEPAAVPSTPSAPVATTWALAWADEFDGRAGAAADSARWTYDVGGSGWGNQELEYYQAGAANAALDGDGHLVITARAEAPSAGTCWYGACRYTSARLLTKGKFAATYGRFEARLKLPAGQGLWPAFWMLGDNIDAVGWPRSGEIDVMENIGKEPSTVHGTMHGPGYSGASGIGGSAALDRGTVADDFHVYAVEWEPLALRWYVDDRLYRTSTPADLPSGTGWVYDHPFFLILNVAVGGQWPGSPDATTTFPQRMTVDYVRVYRKSGS
jgi:beta-glucanase (GH16 family)